MLNRFRLAFKGQESFGEDGGIGFNFSSE